jgi:hypothetical protein
MRKQLLKRLDKRYKEEFKEMKSSSFSYWIDTNIAKATFNIFLSF